MSNFDLQKDTWLEIVFEGKNKSYGAYQLRQDEGKNTMKALFSMFALLGLVFLLVSFRTNDVKPIENKPVLPPITVVPTEIFKENDKKVEPEKKVEPKGTTNTKKNINPNTQPQIVNDTEVKPIGNPDLPHNPNGTDHGNNPGIEGKPEGKTTEPTTPTGGNGTNNTTEVNIVSIAASFPGGINEFREKVAENFTPPSNLEAGSITFELSFIIEIDGSISNIKVIKGDKKYEKEAARTLFSIKKKWKPAQVNGQPVRMEKILPITIIINDQE